MKITKTRRGKSLLFQGRIAEKPQYADENAAQLEKEAIRAYEWINKKHKLDSRAFVAQALLALREKLEAGYVPVTDTQNALQMISQHLGQLSMATQTLLSVANDIASGVIVAPSGYADELRKQASVFDNAKSELTALATYNTQSFEDDDDSDWG